MDAVTKASDVVLRAEGWTAFVASHWWPANPGHVLVVPDVHVENLYELPDSLGVGLVHLSRRIAVALKQAYGCDGTSTRQHNEPAGYQDVWHFHQHVFPRWRDDRLYERTGERAPAPADERARRAALLRDALATGDDVGEDGVRA